jgi:hypothetical protein
MTRNRLAVSPAIERPCADGSVFVSTLLANIVLILELLLELRKVFMLCSKLVCSLFRHHRQ